MNNVQGFIAEKHRFWINALVSLQVAAQLINHFKIYEHDFGPALIRAAMTTLESEQADAIKAAMSPAKTDTAKFDDFIRFVGPFTLIVDGQEAFVKSPMRAIHARHEVKNNRLFVSKSFFADWCREQGLNIRELGSALEKRRVIVGRPSTNLVLGTHMTPSRTQCLEVDLLHFEHLVGQLEASGLQGELPQDEPSALAKGRLN